VVIRISRWSWGANWCAARSGRWRAAACGCPRACASCWAAAWRSFLRTRPTFCSRSPPWRGPRSSWWRRCIRTSNASGSRFRSRPPRRSSSSMTPGFGSCTRYWRRSATSAPRSGSGERFTARWPRWCAISRSGRAIWRWQRKDRTRSSRRSWIRRPIRPRPEERLLRPGPGANDAGTAAGGGLGWRGASGRIA